MTHYTQPMLQNSKYNNYYFDGVYNLFTNIIQNIILENVNLRKEKKFDNFLMVQCIS